MGMGAELVPLDVFVDDGDGFAAGFEYELVAFFRCADLLARRIGVAVAGK